MMEMTVTYLDKNANKLTVEAISKPFKNTIKPLSRLPLKLKIPKPLIYSNGIEFRSTHFPVNYCFYRIQTNAPPAIVFTLKTRRNACCALYPLGLL